jgi:DNA (cytosine-5)-methyltransferase 1
MRNVEVADLFCGAGGTSEGLGRAAEALGVPLNLVAINHWNQAVASHKRNHPWARHICADLGCLDPNKVIPGGRLDVLLASPECTYHSRACGAKPCSDQSRASAFHVTHWLERLRVEQVCVENVPEFEEWGPLLRRRLTWRGKTYQRLRPDPRRKGETFRAWVGLIESMGYRVEWRRLNAADYGGAQARVRLFVRAARRGAIEWPAASHVGRHRGAREIIDWELKGKSIFGRHKPLQPRTMQRIMVGLERFGGAPFLAVLRGTHERQSGSWARSVDAPLPTISAGGVHVAICEPFIIPMEHSGRGALRGVREPLPTITTARGGALGLVTVEPQPQPFLVKYYGTGENVASVDQPLPTITTKDRLGLVETSGYDVLFRMLQPHELAAGQGLERCQFEGTKEAQVRQIGNAVERHTAQALCTSMLRRRSK